MNIIVGLGNFATEYANTRHNAGFWCVEALAHRYHINWDERRKSTSFGRGLIEGKEVILAKPRTFMNASGIAVRYLLERFNLSLDNLLIVYDDLDLPIGTIRLRPHGTAGGHHGLESVIEGIGNSVFPRLRIGIGRPPIDVPIMQYVLAMPSPDEHQVLSTAVDTAVDAIGSFLVDGLEIAMNRFN